jgi:hypothetical protein
MGCPAFEHLWKNEPSLAVINLRDDTIYGWVREQFVQAAQRLIDRAEALPALPGGCERLEWLREQYEMRFNSEPLFAMPASADAQAYVSRAWGKARAECMMVMP